MNKDDISIAVIFAVLWLTVVLILAPIIGLPMALHTITRLLLVGVVFVLCMVIAEKLK